MVPSPLSHHRPNMDSGHDFNPPLALTTSPIHLPPSRPPSEATASLSRQQNPTYPELVAFAHPSPLPDHNPPPKHTQCMVSYHSSPAFRPSTPLPYHQHLRRGRMPASRSARANSTLNAPESPHFSPEQHTYSPAPPLPHSISSPTNNPPPSSLGFRRIANFSTPLAEILQIRRAHLHVLTLPVTGPHIAISSSLGQSAQCRHSRSLALPF